MATIKKPTLNTDAALAFAEEKPKRQGKAIAKPKKKAQRATQKAAKSDGKINKVRGGQSGLVPPGYRRLTANIPNDLYRKMKVKAAMEDRTIVSILEELLEKL